MKTFIKSPLCSSLIDGAPIENAMEWEQSAEGEKSLLQLVLDNDQGHEVRVLCNKLFYRLIIINLLGPGPRMA